MIRLLCCLQILAICGCTTLPVAPIETATVPATATRPAAPPPAPLPTDTPQVESEIQSVADLTREEGDYLAAYYTTFIDLDLTVGELSDLFRAAMEDDTVIHTDKWQLSMFSAIGRMRDLGKKFRALPVPERFTDFAVELYQALSHVDTAMDELTDIVNNALNKQYDDFDEYTVSMKAAGDARDKATAILIKMGIAE